MKKKIKYLTVRQCAELRGVKLQTIYLWFRHGLKYSRRYGILIVVKEKDILEYVPGKVGAPFKNHNALGGGRRR